jgi:predicted transcriptional regulator
MSYRQKKGGAVMNDIRLGVVEAKFADIVWLNAPLTTKELISICEKELNWKRTTTYTVLKKLCEKGIFKTENSIVSCLISKEDFYSMQSESFVENTFEGSLPAFISAFTKRKKLSEKELKEIKDMINSIEEV